jgi:hypothetical protein
MKPIFLVCCAVLLALGAQAQFYVRGVVLDSAGNLGMAKVSIENRNTAKGVFSSSTGEFVILAKEGDYLIFSSVGFKEAGMQVKAVHRNETVRIIMKPRSVQLKDVTITKGYTPYQLDSIKRASLYKDAFKYKQQKSIMSPISAVQQKFSKKHKNMRKFQSQIIGMEIEKFIDSRYNANLVGSLMGWGEDSSRLFMRENPMEYDFARTASELEIKLWIKYRAEQFRKNEGLVPSR